MNGEAGEGFDNYVELRGINYNAEGGGNWMGVDHVSLDAELSADGIVFTVDGDNLVITNTAPLTFNVAGPGRPRHHL